MPQLALSLWLPSLVIIILIYHITSKFIKIKNMKEN